MRHGSKLGLTGIALLAVFAASAACSSSSNDNGGAATGEAVTALRGTIKSAAGAKLAGVALSAGGASATTDAEGRFDLRAPAGAAVVKVTKDGFVDQVKAVDLLDGRPTQLDVTLLPLATPVPLDATLGGSVASTRAATLVAPANAFVDSSGQPVSGMVDVYLTPLDPSVTNERATAPSFVSEAAGARGMLESFGMMDVTVKQGDKKLQVAPGSEIEIHIPAPESRTTPEPTIPLWSFDEAKGVWVDEGTATYDAATKTYVGKTKHMSMWNADKVYLASCVCGVVKEKNGGALPGARIDAEGLTYNGSTSTNTDLNGKFCVAVRKDSEISVAAYHASGGGQARDVSSGSADTDVPAKIGDARCVDVGEWVVEKDVFVGADGSAQSCNGLSNPFASGCAGEFFSVFGTCYRPEGACTIKTDTGGSSTTTYANGSKSETTTTETKYYGPSGQLCATSAVEGFDTGGGKIRYTLPNGNTYTITVAEEASSDMIITCTDGTEIRVTPQQRQALDACGGGGKSDGQQCTIQGGGGVPSSCTDDSTCNGDVCCAIPDSSTKLCLPQSTCDMIK